MARLGRAHEIVVGQLQFRRKRLPDHRQVIAIRLRRLPFRLRRLLHLLPVLVQPRQEEYLLSQAPPRPGDDVRHDFLVGVAQVRLAIDVIDGGRDIKSLAHLPLL